MVRSRPALTLGLVVALVALVAGCSAEREPGRPVTSTATTAPKPVRAERLDAPVLATIGVVSANKLRDLRYRPAKDDWDRLTARHDVDLIGWQEANSASFARLAPTYVDRGWQTWQDPDPEGPTSVAFSWRSDVLELVDVTWTQMHGGAGAALTDHPFPARWVVQAQLRHRATGRTITLLNTHVNQHIETGHGFEHNLNAERAQQHLRTLARMWDTVPGDVVVGTGDYNVDRADDAAYRPAHGITRTFAGRAVSSYDALGLTGVVPTRKTRWIDYVWLSSDSVDSGRAQFATHRSLSGYHSDHRPMLARIRLYA